MMKSVVEAAAFQGVAAAVDLPQKAGAQAEVQRMVGAGAKGWDLYNYIFEIKCFLL